MRKRNLTVLIVICGILVLGVGYAAATATSLSITGAAKAQSAQSDFVVGFDTATAATKSGGVTAASVTDASTATFSATLSTAKNTGYAQFTVKNSSPELSAKITVAVTSSDANATKYFTITPSVTTATIAHGASTTVKVKVDLKKLPVSDVTGNFTVTVTATPVEA